MIKNQVNPPSIELMTASVQAVVSQKNLRPTLQICSSGPDDAICLHLQDRRPQKLLFQGVLEVNLSGDEVHTFWAEISKRFIGIPISEV